MRIPILSQYQDYKAAKLQAIKAETQFFNERTAALKINIETRDKALNAVMKMAEPVMTLNSELYNINIWSQDQTSARRLSRITYWESPEAQAMLGRFVDMVYGSRLELQYAPAWELIPKAPVSIEERQALVKNIELRYRLWAKSKNGDYNEKRNHYQQSRRNFLKLLLDGKYLCILRYSQSRQRNPLTVQYINPDNLSEVVYSGGECATSGKEIAYKILDDLTGETKTIQKWGTRSKRQFVIHNELEDGAPLLSGIITTITKLSDLTALELQAILINALFAVWVKTDIGGTDKPLVRKEGVTATPIQAGTYGRLSDSEYAAKLNKTDFTKGGNIIQGMGEGQTLESFDTKRPTANFEQFYNLLKRGIYAAKGMSMAVADFHFDASYSAARGELLVFWNRVEQLRYDHETDYEYIIFRAWLQGEVDNMNVNLPGFEIESIQDAWCMASWTGPQRPDIDDLRSAKAHEIDSKHGWKTDSMIAAERGGGDWDENIQRKEIENGIKARVNKVLTVLENTTYSNSTSKNETTSEIKGQ